MLEPIMVNRGDNLRVIINSRLNSQSNMRVRSVMERIGNFMKSILFLLCLTFAFTANAQGTSVQPVPTASETPPPAAPLKNKSSWISQHGGLRLDGMAALPINAPQNTWYSWGGAWHLHGYLDVLSFLDVNLQIGQHILSLNKDTKDNPAKSTGGAFEIDLGLRLKRPMSMGHQVSPFFEGGTGMALTGDNVSGGLGPRWELFAGAGILFRGKNWPIWIGPSVRYTHIFAYGTPANYTLKSDASLLSFGLTIDFNAGGSDFDGDGVQNAQDYCSATKGPAYMRGCPQNDADGDGIPDAEDNCPNVPGSRAAKGCPDRDNDGVTDDVDACPDLAGSPSANGCPDSDGDGVPDSVDQCPNLPGAASANGCPDRDGDGVPDDVDQCPSEPGSKAARGCPDQDNDGVPDNLDRCPNFPGKPELKGCLDTDDDGVTDDKDLCPKVPGVASNNGCPVYKSVVIKADRIELKQKILFAVGRSQILPKSNGVLNDISDVLKNRDGICVRVEGHTDSRGVRAKNVTLSEQRAESVVNALTRRGIDGARLTPVGYGPDQPVDSNATVAGRENNRRVEFVTIDCKTRN